MNKATQRNWVTFRQFDQALSDYYREKNVSIPIYTGHFQPSVKDWGIRFEEISGTLNLYGSDNHNKFFSTNNSSIDVDGKDGKYAFAAQGLVNAALSNGTLMTADNKSPEPHFDESFLLGKNSKNAVLGEVYHNVSFPFKKKKDTHGVDYWWFDSSQTTLAMQKDPSTREYYLKDTGNKDWAKNVNSSGTTDTNAGQVSNTYGFFPFNEGTTAASGKNYNYGFGTKLEIKFRLTENGRVQGNNGEVPIIFAFSGDDDVWVFIDGKLALDVGGAHGKVTGTLDFENLKAKVSEVKKSAADGAAGDAGTNKTTDFTLKGDKQDEHTLTMFYMERGMWESNMKITFNFPDENEFAVEKQVDTSAVNELFDDSFEDASVFPFTIQNQATHYGTTPAGSGTTVETMPFNRFDSDSSVSKPENSDITFKREDSKAGQIGVAHWRALLDDADRKA
ncbi:MAG: fibro-slime domain-containing protein [Gallintestinimicrobium sp.]